MGKKRVALIVGYNGLGYRGSQMNKDENTVEKVICDKISQLMYISKRNSEDYSKVGLQRSSRTDKGVHAAMLVLSLKIEMGEGRSIKDLEAKLKESLLSHGIFLHRIVETTKNFDAKARCESRVYEYFVPQNAYTKGSASPEETERRKKVFISALKSLEGTHNFHNFTVQTQERGTNRYIKEITIKEVLLGGVLWNRIVLHGQSFMIHQIRKMVGFAVLSAQRALSEEDLKRYVSEVFSKEKRNIPKVPGSLLLLSHSYFTNYNERFGNERGVIDNRGCTEYKESTLYPALCTEANASSFSDWQEVIDKHLDEFTYLQ